MRFVFNLILALILALAAAPVFAAEWGHYVNDRFGVEADVPPGFVAGEPPVNGDGLRFSTPTARLSIYGSLIVEREFMDAVQRGMKWSADEGWKLTYQAVTPSWASWSGQAGQPHPLCPGDPHLRRRCLRRVRVRILRGRPQGVRPGGGAAGAQPQGQRHRVAVLRAPAP